MKVNEYGRSMIEILGVLAIMAVLTTAGITGYSKMMTQYKIKKLTDAISSEISDIRTNLQESYDALNNYEKKGFGNFRGVRPEGLYIEKACALEQDGDDMAFCVGVHGVNRKECAALLAKDWSGTRLFALIMVPYEAGEIDEANVVTSTFESQEIVEMNGGVVVSNGKAIPVSLAKNCSDKDNSLLFKFL